jgi:ubiquinone/menaquinone biosynthesis C-methylase UbiE
MQFNEQADIYDERTGLGEKTAQNIAVALKHMIEPYLTGQFLEIGAGTGEIGFFLQGLAIPYAGIDLSDGMLDVYRNRYQNIEDAPHLIQTDGNDSWPFDNKSVSVFFSSRAMHQLDQKNVLTQLQNLSDPKGAVLILGNVKRDKKSAKAIMRKEMHKILNELGLKEKSGQSNRNQLFEAIEKQGGERLKPVTASRWQVSHAPINSINSWKKVDGIAGQTVEPAIKQQILESLILKAQDEFPNINQTLETEESYELNAIRLP